MKRWLFLLINLISGLSLLVAQSHSHKMYHHDEKHTVKGLPAQQVQGYLSGEGMGMALAAELNHFPGPRHVLDLADSLHLAPQQHQQVQAIYERMHQIAVHLGKQIVEKEAQLETLFFAETPDSQQVRSLLIQLGGLKGRLRWTHIRAHLLTRKILTPAQINLYDHLRGYIGS